MELKTGDLLLCDGGSKGLFGWISSMIKMVTRSNISHIGMILKDPDFIHPSLKGYYVWESAWEGTPDPQDDKVKFGVQITPLEEIIKEYKQHNGAVYVRLLSTNEPCFTSDVLANIHKVVYDKAYDIVPSDWLSAIWRRDEHPQKVDRFWCSALVGYIYVQCGILDPSTDWSVLRPSDFTVQYEQYLSLTGKGSLGKERRL